mmetsp:Transcript_50221/g.98452  ORF Transcript_50221/g.98452 Transcript_50221/m.98452 type:complete len:220 (-) Transcript_50221:102-761(-)
MTDGLPMPPPLLFGAGMPTIPPMPPMLPLPAMPGMPPFMPSMPPSMGWPGMGGNFPGLPGQPAPPWRQGLENQAALLQSHIDMLQSSLTSTTALYQQVQQQLRHLDAEQALQKPGSPVRIDGLAFGSPAKTQRSSQRSTSEIKTESKEAKEEPTKEATTTPIPTRALRSPLFGLSHRKTSAKDEKKEEAQSPASVTGEEQNSKDQAGSAQNLGQSKKSE